MELSCRCFLIPPAKKRLLATLPQAHASEAKLLPFKAYVEIDLPKTHQWGSLGQSSIPWPLGASKLEGCESVDIMTSSWPLKTFLRLQRE